LAGRVEESPAEVGGKISELDNFVLFLKLQSLFKVGKRGSELVLSLCAFAAKEKRFAVVGLDFKNLVQELNGLIKLLNA
jgi:hypothetical protein